jgi:hypothetical protein
MKRGFFFWKNLNSIAKFVIVMFFSYLHNWIKFLNLNMTRFQLLEGLKCESQIENIGKEKNWGRSLPNNT